MGGYDVKRRKLSRREFLRGGAAAGAGLVLSRLLAGGGAGTPGSSAQDVPNEEPTRAVYMPYISRVAPPPMSDSRVVHVRSGNATNWNGSGWYGSAVSQTVVDTMTQQGLQELTGQSSWADVWHTLFSRVQPAGYQTGQKIAIKVSFNNSWNGGCSGDYTQIDALPQPVKALIAGLTAAGVAQSDIWIYDATTTEGRIIPDRFRNPLVSSYPGVTFYGKGTCTGVNQVTFNHVHSSLAVQFSDPPGYLTDRWLPDLLYQATFVINMPILKRHGISPVSLGFKNHFGSLDNIMRLGNDSLHPFISPSNSLYVSTYSPVVDIFKNSNIRNKTILTVGDALYGAFGATYAPPVSWSTFSDAPNSLFLAQDPVAIDCVMADFLVAEGKVGNDAYDYLFTAQDAGLGVCEGTRSNPGGDPWQTPYGNGYSEIQYIRRDL